MDGRAVVKMVESALARKDMTKGEFYQKTGISSATFSQWRTGQYEPSAANLRKIEEVLGLRFSPGLDSIVLDETAVKMDSETAKLLEQIRSRQDLRVLLRSAKDVPPSSVYELVSKLEKMKEDAN
jgi:transcriptional regulator with XRE-family HTH domain